MADIRLPVNGSKHRLMNIEGRILDLKTGPPANPSLTSRRPVIRLAPAPLFQ